MLSKKLNGSGVMTISGTDIHVRHLDKILIFDLPMLGPHDFDIIMESRKTCRWPTTAQMFSLLDVVLENPEEEYCRDIRNRNRFFTATENLWGGKDVIVYDDPWGKMPHVRESLIKRHKDGDNAIRIVPYGFKTGVQSVNELLQNPYLIAQIGSKDLLDTVKRVAEKAYTQCKPSIHVRETTKNQYDVRRCTEIGFSLNNDSLYLNGDISYNYYNASASPVIVIDRISPSASRDQKAKI